MRFYLFSLLGVLLLSQVALAEDTSGVTPDQKYLYMLERAYDRLSGVAVDNVPFVTDSFRAKYHLKLEQQRRDEALALKFKIKLINDNYGNGYDFNPRYDALKTKEKNDLILEEEKLELEAKDEKDKADVFGQRISGLAKQKDFLSMKQLIFEKRAENLRVMESRGLDVSSLRAKEQERMQSILVKLNETDKKIKERLKE